MTLHEVKSLRFVSFQIGTIIAGIAVIALIVLG